MIKEFLAEPDEAEQAADYHLKAFQAEGARIGEPISLVVKVSQIPEEKTSRVEARIREYFDCARLEKGMGGIPFFKQPTIHAYLKPMAFERANLVASSESLYRLILDENVAVCLELA